MAGDPVKAPLPETVEEALALPWKLLDFLASAEDPDIRRQQIFEIEDAAASEDRVRRDYSGRYPMELLQNAHDACADANTSGAVRFVVTDSALLVANQGVPFTPERVHSLIRLGASSKLEPGAHHTIGYKGVGFTAVFEMTDRPQIISKGASLEFDRRRASREVERKLGFKPKGVAARGFPFRLEASDWKEDSEAVDRLLRGRAVTVIRLPFASGIDGDMVGDHLRETLPSQVLLFMPSTNLLELRLPEMVGKVRKRIGQRVGSGQLVSLSGGERPGSWLVAEDRVRASRKRIDALDDPLWSGVRDLHIGAALPWRRNQPDPSVGEQQLHVYFPTDDQLGRTLLLHGDFYVDSSRRHVATEGTGADVSEYVGEEVAKLAVSLAESVADRGGRLLECLAQTGTSSGFGESLTETIQSRLERARIARPADGSDPQRPLKLKRLAVEPASLERDIVDLIPKRKLLLHPDDDYEPAAELLEELGTEELEWPEIARMLDPRGSRAEYRQTCSALLRLINESEAWEPETVEVLRSRPVLQDTTGRWRRPDELVIPTADSPELPSDLRAPELHDSSHQTVKRVSNRLGIRTLDLDGAIDLVIAATGKRFAPTSRKARAIYRFMRRAWTLDRKTLERRRADLGRMPVPARHARGTKKHWRPAGSVYFPSVWTGDAGLEQLYGRFGAPEFLAETPPRDASRKDLINFFEVLGVAAAPREVDLSFDWNHLPSDGLTHLSDWMALDSVVEALKCKDGHRHSGRDIRLRVLDRLDGLLDEVTPVTGAALARYLSRMQQPYGAPAEMRCTNANHSSGAPSKSSSGYQRWRIETSAWVPVKGDPTGEQLRAPGEVWTGTIPKKIQLPRFALQADPRGLALVQSAQPGAGAVESALRELQELFPDLSEAPTEVVVTSKWLLRKLDRASQRADNLREPPLLPAVTFNGLIWANAPLIPDMPFSGVLEQPLLEPGQWKGLHRGYGLRRLSDVIEPNVEVIGKRGGLRPVLSGNRRANLAVVLANQGADGELVTRRLAKLVERHVDDLTVGYKLDGEVLGEPLQPPLFLDLIRNKRGERRGATLFVRATPGPSDVVTLAGDLASYLDEPALQDSIGLFLTNSQAVIDREHISAEALEEAERQIASHARREQDEVEPDLPDLITAVRDAAGTGPTGARAPEPGTGRDEKPVERQIPDAPPEDLPPLQHDEVSAMDVSTTSDTSEIVIEDARSQAAGDGQYVGGKAATVNWAGLDHEKRLYGERGEEVAIENERRRLQAEGLDPDSVRWVSRDDAAAPFDIESIDDDGGPRYIEVKSTSGLDPTDPFEISAPELWFALAHAERHFIYRVTDVKNPAPDVYRYRSPLSMLKYAGASLSLSQAKMSLPEPAE